MHCCTEAWNQALEILNAHLIDRAQVKEYNESEALQTIVLLFRFKAKESLICKEALFPMLFSKKRQEGRNVP